MAYQKQIILLFYFAEQNKKDLVLLSAHYQKAFGFYIRALSKSHILVYKSKMAFYFALQNKKAILFLYFLLDA
jgi:hypothetical protein